MAIESIAGITAAVQSASTAASSATGSSSDFGAWLQQEIGAQLNETSRQIGDAENKLQSFAAGESGNLHDLMISLEKAKLSFELVLAVRNKALEAYQEMMRMQI